MYDPNRIIRDRIRQMQSRILDGIDNILDRMKPPPALPAPSRPVMRRLVANTLGLWRVCANTRCKRGKCCRGEPLDCLRYGFPLLTPEQVAALLPQREVRTQRRPKNQPNASSTTPKPADTRPCL